MLNDIQLFSEKPEKRKRKVADKSTGKKTKTQENKGN